MQFQSLFSKNFSRRHFEVLFYFFQKISFVFYANCLQCGDNLQKIQSLFSGEKMKNMISLSQQFHEPGKKKFTSTLKDVLMFHFLD